ncbi:site-specific integrase [Microvirga alba]|uniref:Uncharacterized protein n=1 Tax=Microvirga alba TaxID=2791025 RepID=A0A931BJ40_9HYPH|nr:hypothetical protein [Microvirga alba]MBF9232141.1 hypothetical protein [Microvirga alba]
MLKKQTSESNGTEVAEHDLRKNPDLLAMLMAVLETKHIGPIILDESSGKPWRRATFSRKFRKIAKKAEWPDDLWNMDSRSGAVSEAFEAGADSADLMKAATHTELSTTMGYNRGSIVQTGKVADIRNARRRKPEKSE